MKFLSHTPFQWFGGKWEIGDWLAHHMPRASTLVLTHGGAGSPLWHVEPYPVEVYNDIDGNVVAFFRACREQPEALASLLLLTPYSREEWRRCFDTLVHGDNVGDELERARMFATVARQSMAGAWGRAWSSVIKHSRRGMASGNSRWLRLPETVLEVAARLSSVQIECMDAIDLIERYDGYDTLFYIDPPYHPDTRQAGVYRHEYSEADHVRLLDTLCDSSGKVCLSGYRCELYDTRLAGWCREDRTVTCRSNVGTNGDVAGRPTRVESLWMNF